MNARSADASRPRFSLGAKLVVALLGGGAAMLVFLFVYFGPRTEGSFLERSRGLLERSTETMRELAQEDVELSQQVLSQVIHHTTDARRRFLADVPLGLYDDVERVRDVIAREDAERGRRLENNVGLIGAEMTRRSTRRIDEHLGLLTREQEEAGASFARDVRQSYLILSGSVFTVLILLLGVGMYQGVVRPVQRLQVATRAVTRGDLTVQLDARGRDEIAVLSADFAEMVGQLRQSRGEVRQKNLALQTLNQNLEQEVRAKTQHLEEALNDLRRTQRQLIHVEKMATVGTLARGVAHEFNNVIGGIQGCAHEALEARSDGERREALEVILRAARRGSHVTEQLLRFSRQEVAAMERVDVGTVVEEALRLVEPEARRLGVRVERSLPGPLEARADASALHQVLLNLFTNALQAMPEGGTLSVTGEAGPAELVLRVRDTGVGIPPEALDHVFEPFYTTKDREADPARRGTGLGLAVSYGIVAAHSGSLSLESEVGQGSTVTLRLPRLLPDPGGVG